MESNVNLSIQGSSNYKAGVHLIENHDLLWKKAIMNSAKDPKRIINASGTLRHEDYLTIMEKVTEIRRKNLNGINDLMANGLSIPVALSDQLVGVENINEFQVPNISMNPVAKQNNVIDFDIEYTPSPMIDQSFTIPYRQQEKTYLSTFGVSEVTRQIAEKLESVLFLGAPEIVVTVSGVQTTVYGYTTHPNRQTFTIVDWTDLATNQDLIIADVLAMVNLAFINTSVVVENSMILYVAEDIWTNMEADYSTLKGDRTFKERIEAITAIKEVKYGSSLVNGTVLLAEMSERTVVLAVASDIRVLPNFRTDPIGGQTMTGLAAMTPIIKSDRNGKTGIVHGTP